MTATTVATIPGGLVEQVACLDRLDPEMIQRVRHEVLTVPTGWQAAYGGFQSGGWWTLSLLNSTGNASDVVIGDCDAVETNLLARMPMTRSLLRGLGLRYMWVRLARLSGNSFLWEHRDYAELASTERHRLHIPLQTNSSAHLVIAGTQVHMAPDRIWRLTPTFAHGVANRLGPNRIHLILDCYADDRLADLTAGQYVPEDGIRPLRPLTEADTAKHLRAARNLALVGYLAEAEQYLLKVFFSYATPEGASYDLVAQMHESLGRPELAVEWRQKKDVMLPRIPAQIPTLPEEAK